MSLENKTFNEPVFSHWLEPEFPINFFIDLSNYSILVLFLYLYYKFKTNINPIFFIISSLMMLTPFFINGFIIEWSLFPDQSKYVSSAKLIRENLLSPKTIFFFLAEEPGHIKVYFSSLIYNLVPITSFETFKSIGFVNRFIFIFMLIFL